MADKSNIGWTDSSWNPIRGFDEQKWICTKISAGCDFCYASGLAFRFGGQHYVADGNGPVPLPHVTVRLDRDVLMQPIQWVGPRMIFVCSMTDLFGEWVPEEWLDEVFAVALLNPRHVFQVLTKRAKRMKEYLNAGATESRVRTAAERLYIGVPPRTRRRLVTDRLWPLGNVWAGVSVELGALAWRANLHLAETNAAVRWVSAEPLLGPLDKLRMERACPWCVRGTIADGEATCPYCAGHWLSRALDWLVIGGESNSTLDRYLVRPCRCLSGPLCLDCGGTTWRPRADKEAWVRDLIARAQRVGTPTYFKQWGGPRPTSGGRTIDGTTYDDFPAALVDGEWQPRHTTRVII
jgi:protein gp37